MEREDLFYLCDTIGNLSGIPLRVYEGDEQIYYHALVDLPKDPMLLYQVEIWKITVHVGYFSTPYFDFYGVVNAPPYRLILGPTRQVEAPEAELRAQAFEADVPARDVAAFIQAMQNIIRMPLDSVLQILCTINFELNRERLALADIVLVTQDEPHLSPFDPALDSKASVAAPPPRDYDYTGYAVEQRLMDIVGRGDRAALKAWLEHAPAIRPGILSADALRQLKNLFVVSTTLASRAAIRGGLDTKTAFSLSDAYIQRCELLKDPAKITNLQYSMISDYTERVGQIRIGHEPTPLSLRVANYVHSRLSDTISLDKLANELYLSRSRLTARFKEETGQTIADFIAGIKIAEAGRLLRFTDKSLISISVYLGFSSQSHFTRVFKKHTGLTPGEYRSKPAE